MYINKMFAYPYRSTSPLPLPPHLPHPHLLLHHLHPHLLLSYPVITPM